MAEENNAVAVKVPVVTLENYAELAGRTEKVPVGPVEISPLDKGVIQRGLQNAVLVGQALDALKRHWIYGKREADIGHTLANLEQAALCGNLPFIPDSLTVDQFRLLHAAIGKVTEAGEFLESILAHLKNGVPLDRTNVIEELGDGNWYDAIPMNILGISHQEVLQKNIEKLAKRYGAKYSDLSAIERNTSAEREVLEKSNDMELEGLRIVSQALADSAGCRVSVEIKAGTMTASWSDPKAGADHLMLLVENLPVDEFEAAHIAGGWLEMEKEARVAAGVALAKTNPNLAVRARVLAEEMAFEYAHTAVTADRLE